MKSVPSPATANSVMFPKTFFIQALIISDESILKGNVDREGDSHDTVLSSTVEARVWGTSCCVPTKVK